MVVKLVVPAEKLAEFLAMLQKTYPDVKLSGVYGD